jgi:hypothetical protein
MCRNALFTVISEENVISIKFPALVVKPAQYLPIAQGRTDVAEFESVWLQSGHQMLFPLLD